MFSNVSQNGNTFLLTNMSFMDFDLRIKISTQQYRYIAVYFVFNILIFKYVLQNGNISIFTKYLENGSRPVSVLEESQ